MISSTVRNIGNAHGRNRASRLRLGLRCILRGPRSMSIENGMPWRGMELCLFQGILVLLQAIVSEVLRWRYSCSFVVTGGAETKEPSRSSKISCLSCLDEPGIVTEYYEVLQDPC